MDEATRAWIASHANWVQSTAKDFGGVVTMRFSQALPPVGTVLDFYPTTTGGICNALCNKWIAEHANDRSLWTWLCPRGTPDLGALSSLMMQFMDKRIPWQDKRTAYLRLYRVIERHDVANSSRGTGYNLGNQEQPDADIGRRIAELLTYGKLKNSQGSYRAISLWGKGGAGHAVCAWVAQDACFFDPNFGEFYFERYADFARWAPVFGRVSGYGRSYGGLWVRDFARKV